MPKILLVEDNEMNRDMLSRRLERKGYEVVIAVDGAQGVAMATHREARPDPDGHEPAGARRLGGDAAAQGRRARRQAIPIIAPDRARDGRRTRKGAGGRLRRLRHQAGRAAAPAREDRSACSADAPTGATEPNAGQRP